MIHSLTRTTLVLSMAAGGLLLVGSPAGATTSTVASPTAYALNASGYATRVIGGELPAGSGPTAAASIGCTNSAGLSKVNGQATIDLGDLATISAAKTHVWTTDTGGTVSSWSRNAIADADFLDSGLGSLNLHGIVSLSRTYHNDSGFHASTRATLASITLTVAGVPTSFPVPPPGETLTIPGVATITLGVGTRSHTPHQAAATLDSVTVVLIPTGTKVILGHTHAQIHDGVQSALFNGSSYGIKVSVLDGIGRIGATPSLSLPCQGTKGTTVSRSVASIDLDGIGIVQGVAASQSADQSHDSADAWERGKAARIDLAGGDLIITGVVGRAHASYVVGGGVHRDTRGTKLAKVIFNGSELKFPAHGSLVIAGIARLTPKVTHRTAHGISVTALQISLLSGSGATINLGHAQVKITPSGL
jgi:hypothetical protein